MNVKHFPPKGFSERLYDSFIKTGKTITEVSRETGISRTSVYDYIYTGVVPNIGNFADLCKALGQSADYLLFGERKR